MVEVAVGRHREHGAFSEAGNLLAETHQAGAGIDQEAVLPPAHKPDVAAVERQDVRLLEVHDAVIQHPHPIPAIRRLYSHGASLRSRRENLPDGTAWAPVVQSIIPSRHGGVRFPTHLTAAGFCTCQVKKVIARVSSATAPTKAPRTRRTKGSSRPTANNIFGRCSASPGALVLSVCLSPMSRRFHALFSSHRSDTQMATLMNRYQSGFLQSAIRRTHGLKDSTRTERVDARRTHSKRSGMEHVRENFDQFERSRGGGRSDKANASH